jgi:hypothetical protein
MTPKASAHTTSTLSPMKVHGNPLHPLLLLSLLLVLFLMAGRKQPTHRATSTL